MNGLNPQQSQAVSTLNGPLLVLAGAGTGKTQVVTFRIARLIREGTPPERILAVTFTNRAASEMQQRVSRLLPAGRGTSRPLICTFHSLCARILRRHARELGYPSSFAICDRSDQESIARQVLREIRVASESLRPADLLSRIGTWKNSALGPSAAASRCHSDRDHLAAAAYRRYQQSLKAAAMMDFDDLLLNVEQLFEANAKICAEEAARFDQVLIDEYQDTNPSQYRIVRGLASPHRNLCVVGDDDQSIYGWRGAEVKHILEFRNDWPEARIVRLEENYRCTNPILELANRLVAFNRHRHVKVLRAARSGGERPRILQFANETNEAAEIVADIQRRLQVAGITPGDLAILFRTNEQPRTFETELRKAKIPYVLIGGRSFFDRREVRDLIAYLRWLANPSDEVSLLRIINTPARGLSRTTVERLVERAVSTGQPLWKMLMEHRGELGLSATATQGVEQLSELMKRVGGLARRGRLIKATDGLLQSIDYDGEIRRRYADPDERQSRWASVEQVVNAVAEFERDQSTPSLIGFLDAISTGEREIEDEKDKQLKRDAVVLMTLHSAKGLEFSEVYLVGLEEGILPHHRSVELDGDAIEEERRLCYVGLTRAMNRLTLSLSLSRLKWGRARDTIPSRFLFEMTGQAEKAPTAAGAAPRANASRPARRAKHPRGPSRS